MNRSGVSYDGAGVGHSRVVEEYMQYALLGQELLRGALDGRHAGEVQLEEESFPPSLLLERHDRGFCPGLVARSEVHSGIVCKKYFDGLISNTTITA